MSTTNISVMVDDVFMDKVRNDESYWTEFGGVRYSEYKARDIFSMIVEGAWRNGEPGLLFDDRINDSPYKYDDVKIEACNPCGEQSLPPHGSCNLGSLDLSKFLTDDKAIDIEKFETAIRLSMRFLDSVIDVNSFPTKEIEEVGKRFRPVGLGVMGLADYYLERGVAYGSKQALEELSFIMGFMNAISEDESIKMGMELGVPDGCKNLPIPRRNVTTLTVAPTGCQVGGTLLVTDRGFLQLDELGDTSGDTWQDLKESVAQEGSYKMATKFFVNGYQKTKKISLTSGVTLESTYQHKYRILRDGEYLWCGADELVVGDLLVVPLGAYNKTDDLKLIDKEVINYNNNEITTPETVTDDLAEFLGIFFGDGSKHAKGIRLHFNDKELQYKYVADLGERIFGIKPTIEFNHRGCVSVCFNSQTLLRWLSSNDFMKNKSTKIEFTKTIRSFSKRHLLKFMEGYHFADGSYSGDRFYIDTSSNKFAQQWVLISRSLGVDARISKHVSGKGTQMYRVHTIKTRRRIHTNLVDDELKNLGLLNCTVDSVENIEDSENFTFDIEVPVNNCYIANGVVSHNTISLIANCNSGLEPIFSEITHRKDKTGSYTFIHDMAHEPYFRCAVSANGTQEVTWKEHIDTQATAQKHVNSGISKTINFPNHTHKDTIAKAFMYAWESGCKGITVYRNGSREIEVLSPKELKKDRCPLCESDLIKYDGCKKCSECDWSLCTV